jgi:hypothetical protein
MRTIRVRLALSISVVILAMIVPSAAMADAFFVERGFLGMDFSPPLYMAPAVSGDNIVFGSRATAPGSRWLIQRFNLATGSQTVFRSDPDLDLFYPHVAGDWVVWQQNDDIKAKNIRTGAFKDVTNDGVATSEWYPVISGTYVVWWSFNGSNWDIKGRNLATTASPFTVAGGTGNQRDASIYGKRVVYLDDSNGYDNVYVKTIGSSAAPRKITDNAVDQSSPSIGDHLVAWRVQNADAKWMIRYFDYNTGETHDGFSNGTYDAFDPEVSGDRILFSTSNGSNLDLYAWDARTASVPGNWPFMGLAASTANDQSGVISGNEVVYMAGDNPSWGRLVVPTISLASVPTRIARGGHIHLTGSISDQGHRVGGAVLGIERYAAGAWTRIKTLTASPTGTFTYQTPKTYAKTRYRVVYDGKLIFFGAAALDHLSTVSSARTAWPK